MSNDFEIVRSRFEYFFERYNSHLTINRDPIIVYHGCKHWEQTTIIRSPVIDYMLARNKSFEEALAYVDGLIENVTEFDKRYLLQRSLENAQSQGLFNPFVSTSPSRRVARGFALDARSSYGNFGYILTIQAPRNLFYDFNTVRSTYGIPHPDEFSWMEEMGIPIQISEPYEIIQVDYVVGEEEISDCVFRKDGM